jgi:Zn-dependent protease
MRDPLSWSLSLGRLFGINIRVHFLFPIVAVALILRAAYQDGPVVERPQGQGQAIERIQMDQPAGAWIDATLIMGFLFLSVLLHEFGHCFGARAVGGDATDVLLWPLGGLAYVDVPHTPRANFLTAAAGPAVNLLLCLLCAGLLCFVADHPLQPPWDFRGYPGRNVSGLFDMTQWNGEHVQLSVYRLAPMFSRLFWVNWILLLFNLILVGFPMDAGRMLQSVLWHFVGHRQGTLIAVIAGFVTAVLVGIWSIVDKDPLPFALAMFIFFYCYHMWQVLETGGDESVFGYDFSQGYTSLERDEPEPTPRLRRPSWWQRWLQKRAARKVQREMENRQADERRMDQLLEKISVHGMSSLTEEEKRFMKVFSDRYKNRHQ